MSACAGETAGFLNGWGTAIVPTWSASPVAIPNHAGAIHDRRRPWRSHPASA